MAPGLIETTVVERSMEDLPQLEAPSQSLSQSRVNDPNGEPSHSDGDFEGVNGFLTDSTSNGSESPRNGEVPQLINLVENDNCLHPEPLSPDSAVPVNGDVPHDNGNIVYTNGADTVNGNGGHPVNGNGVHQEPPSETFTSSEPFTNGEPAPPECEVKPKVMPIAIIGLAVRAGSASTADEFFEMLSRGRSSFSPEIPPERFNNASFYHPNAGKLGCINTNGACFIAEDITKFDAPFFSITELEATSMDPQQRLLLECTFEALDSAGIQKHTTVGKDIGVFMGAGSPEYEFDLFRDSDTMPMFQATGNHLAMQSNKISHFFDWRGPSVTMDTACSSSLTAFHYACQSIRTGESSVALTGGCNLNLIPEFFINYSTSRLMGNDGRSFSFDARGTGYGRGEGCGIVILKPLDQAIKDNDCIRAIVAATGVNQDGHTPGITMPNGESQEALVRKIYENAGLDPSLTGYVEAHGTGTRVGDPIEVTALHNVFNEGRTKRNPLYLGSVKSNIGHLESASGILAVLKTVVMLDRGFVLPNFDFKKGNPKIPFEEWGLKVPVRQLPWPRGKRYASINNFGFGGTNAHVVLERAPIQVYYGGDRAAIKEEPTKKLFVFSAADKATCQTLCSNLAVYLEQRPEMFQKDLMNDLAYTLGQRRSLLPWRVALTAAASFNLVEKISKGNLTPVKETGNPRIGFVFTGQGAQWWAMGRELYYRYPVFTRVIDEADAILIEQGAPYSLIEELSLDEKMTRVNQAHISQPSCTAIQLALIDLLRSWGIVPTAVIGHSSGEIAAAYAAGILKFDSAMKIAYHRGRLVPVLKERFPDLQGSMMAIGCDKEDIDPILKSLTQGEARIACYNSPQSLTISGDAPAIDELAQILEEKEIFNRKLVIETAYHSHHMELIAEDYLDSIRQLPEPDSSDVRFFSSLTGKLAAHTELNSSYWVQNLTSPVKFAQALALLVAPTSDRAIGVDMIIEIGPHSAMQGPIKQTLKKVGGGAEKILYATTLSRKKDAVDTMLDLASTLFCKGASLNLANVNFSDDKAKTPNLLIDLPRYPWNHSHTYWHESRIAKVHKNRTFPRHDILGTLANYSNELEPTWRNIIRLDDLPWLRHHKIQSLTIFPISGFVSIVIEAAAQQAKLNDFNVEQFELRDLNVHTPLMITDANVELTITLRSSKACDASVSQMRSLFLIHSYSASKGWTENCTGTVIVRTNELNEVNGKKQLEQQVVNLTSKKFEVETSLSEVPQSKIYDSCSGLGIAYGPTFQGLTDCHANETHAVATITRADTAAEMPENFETRHIVHPSFLEQLIQMYWPVLGAGRAPLDVACLSSSIARLTISSKIVEYAGAAGQSLRAYCTAPAPLSIQTPSKVSMFAVAGEETIISIDDLTIAPLPASDTDSSTETSRPLCFKQIWEPILEPLTEYQEVRVDSPQIENQSSDSTFPGTPISIIHGSSSTQLELARMLAAAIESLGNTKVDLGGLEEIDGTDKQLLCITDLDEFILSTMTGGQMAALQTLFQKSSGLLWVTRGAYGQNGDPTGNMVCGFSRAIRSEIMYKFATLDLDAEKKLDDSTAIQAILKVLKTVMTAPTVANTEMEFQERKGEFWTPRIVNDDTVNEYVHNKNFPRDTEDKRFGHNARALRMAISTPGMLESLYFVDDEQKDEQLPADHIEIEVKAIALNTKDIEAAVAGAKSFGQECSGTVSRVGKDVKTFNVGDRVAAISQAAFATYARACVDFAFKISDNVSFEEAASLPLAYCSAQYGLIELARLEDEESLLILDAAGPTGQAAIVLAQNIGATVFATVGTAEDKQVLMDALDVAEDHIFYSRDHQLSASILEATNGRTIDVILSTQADEECVHHALKCIAKFGRFVRQDTGDASAKVKIDLSSFDGNTSLFSFDIHALTAHKPRVVRRLVKGISRSLKCGTLRPIQGSQLMPVSEVSQAFKLGKSSPSSSKIVITLHPDDIVKTTPSKEIVKLFKEDATYILIGGTGGLGRNMARWMADKGAKHLVLLSRSGSVTGPVKTLVDDLSSKGVNIVVISCDVSKRDDVDAMLTKITDLPPIRGVIHGSMTFRDVLFEKMSIDDWTDVISSKVQGAWNFHNALEGVPLDFFIFYSSSAAAMGGRGQAAYGGANAFLDAFAQYRRSLGLPGASLGPTAILDAGYLFENDSILDKIKRNIGMNYIFGAEVLALLEATLDGTADASCNGHIITGVALDPLNMPFWAQDAKYKHLRIAAEAEAALLNDGSKTVSWEAAFKAAESLPDAEQVVCDGLVEKISKTLGLELEELDPTRNISDYALDSLTAIDVRNFITREFESTLQVLELLASGSIRTLTKAVCAKSKVLVGKFES